MSDEEYKEIRQTLQECFEKQEMNKALQIALKIKENFPDHANAAYFNLIYFQTLLKFTEDAIDTLEEGYNKGLWWAESTIRMFPQYDQLIEQPRFASVIDKYLDRYKEIKSKTHYKWVVRTPINYNSEKKYPIFFALHQGDSNIEETEKVWKNVLKHEILLVVPQSSEITGPNTFTWLDIDNGLDELNEIYSEVKNQYNIDSNAIFIAGSSIGGNLALEASLIQPKFSINGCIAINPSLINLDLFSTKLKVKEDKNTKCCILVGRKDPEYEKTKEIMTLLIRNQLSCKFYEIPGLGHAFPEDFEKFLEEMIGFLIIS